MYFVSAILTVKIFKTGISRSSAKTVAFFTAESIWLFELLRDENLKIKFMWQPHFIYSCVLVSKIRSKKL